VLQFKFIWFISGMQKDDPETKEVDRFILEEIDSVPHLEALLLLWRNKTKKWSTDEMAHALYVPADTADKILQDLARRNLIASDAAKLYCYEPSSEDKNSLMRSVEDAYRRELIRVSRMIHSKAAPAIREFARAFRFTKDKDKE
jgi:hypothetical protein